MLVAIWSLRKLTTKKHLEIRILESTINSLIKLQDQWFDLAINLMELSRIWWFDKCNNFKDRINPEHWFAWHRAPLDMKFKQAEFLEFFLQLICIVWKDFFESISKQKEEDIWIYNMILYGFHKDYLNGIDKHEWQIIIDVSDNYDLKFELKMIKNQMINLKFINALLVHEHSVGEKLTSDIYSFYANLVLSFFIIWFMTYKEKNKNNEKKQIVSQWDISEILSSIFIFQNLHV